MKWLIALWRKIRSGVAVIRWALGKQEQEFLLIIRNAGRIRIVSSPSLSAIDARALCQLALFQINETVKKEL